MQQKSTDKMDRTKDTQELAMNTKSTWAVRLLVDHPPRPRGLFATRNPIARARPLRGQTFLPFSRSPKLLTVKIRQPSHEFTFGVGMNFILYPLVLTPVV
jgi:hypothetical protein